MATPTGQHRDGGQGASIESARRTAIVVSLVVAFAIVLGAWLVGGSAGFADIGRGGINQRLLPKVGELAPDFTAYDLLGRPVSLSDFRGQAVWLNFWGSWCPPCRAEMPEIQAAYEQLAPQGVVLLAISLREPPEDAALFAAKNNATFTILTDQNESATGRDYPINNFPTHIFIGPDGVVRHVVLADMDQGEAVAYAKELLASQ